MERNELWSTQEENFVPDFVNWEARLIMFFRYAKQVCGASVAIQMGSSHLKKVVKVVGGVWEGRNWSGKEGRVEKILSYVAVPFRSA
jgi:hypothetical protein